MIEPFICIYSNILTKGAEEIDEQKGLYKETEKHLTSPHQKLGMKFAIIS